MRVHRLAYRVVTFSAALTAAGALVGMAPGAATTSACRSWTGTQPASPGSSGNNLTGVAVVTPCDVWTVGSQISGNLSQTLAERWNGLDWTVATSANPGGSSNNNSLASVAVRSSTDAWAVGNFSNGTTLQTLIEALSGSTWKQVPSQNPGGPANANLLQGVAIVSAANAWAVGAYSNGTSLRSLIEHWNGIKWRQVTSTNASATESDLDAVAAASAKNAWAVGSYANAQGFLQTLIEHWNGTKWRRVPSPDPGGSAQNNTISAVAVTSASNAWAVGTYFSHGIAHGLIAHWNGKAWREARGSILGELESVTAVSATDAWAVGLHPGSSERTLAAHWNGKTWAKVPSPDPGTQSLFHAVAASAADNVWAVGSYTTGGPGLALALHCC